METAYILINCDLGSEEKLIRDIKHIKNVKEVHGTFGAYDIIATVKSKTPKKLRQTVIGEIRNLDHIRSTLTLMGIADVEQSMIKAELIPDIIPEEKKPLEPPTGLDEEFEDDFDDEDEFRTEKK